MTAQWGKKAAGADSAAITIQDATITVSLGQAAYTVNEGGGSVSVPITFSSAIPENVRVAVRSAYDTDTATYNVDFTSSIFPVNVPQGSTTSSYSVSILEDNIREADEKITIRLARITPSAGYAIVVPNQAVITITDNDAPGVTVSESARSVMEDGFTTYTVTLNTKPTADVTITPTSGATDKATVSGPVTFTPDNWNQPKTITVTGVKAGKATISHRASGSDPFYAGSLSIDSVAVTVASSSVYEISATATASEGGNAELTVTLGKDAPTGGLEFTVTPAYASGAGKAAAADLSSPPTTVSVAGNQRTATLSIPIAPDALVEGDETFTVTIATDASGWNKTADGADTATVTITDLTREVSLAASTYTVGESDGKVTVGLTLSSAHADTITATLTFSGGNATPGADYGDSSTATTAQASFAPGATSATLDVAIKDDLLAEGSETFTVTITAVSTGHAIGSSSAATVTITDDESEGVTVAPTTLSVVEFDERTYTVTLGSQPTHDVTVAPASSSTDNATVSGPVTFTTLNWNEPKTITVTGVKEGSSIISHAVTSDDATYDALTIDPVAVTVTPYGKTYTITSAVTATEGAHATLFITLGESAPTYGLTFEVEPAYGDPASDKAQADDIGGVQSTLTVSPGEKRVRIGIPIVANDLLGEEDETFTVSIKKVHVRNIPVPEWKVDPSGTDSATVTIKDSAAAIAFGADAAATTRYAASVAENVASGTLNVPVTVSHLPAESTTFTIEVAGTSTATAYADDANPGDYRIADKTVTFGPTDSSKTKNVVIAITDDDDVEAPETITLNIAAAADPAVALGDRYARDANGATAIITISSDDAAADSTKTYTITPSATAGEGENAQLTVTLGENAPEGGLEFSVAYSNGRTSPNSLTVTAGSDSATLDIPILRDSVVGNSRTFTVSLATNALGWAVAADGTNKATVAATDTTGLVSFSASRYTVIEGNAAQVVVTRTGPTNYEARVSLTGFGRGPVRGVSLYFTRTVTIPAGASGTAVVIETKDNNRAEGDGYVGVFLGNPSVGSSTGGTTFAALTIKDNDGEQYASTYTMASSAVTATEGGNAELTVNLDENAHADGLKFTVYYDYSNGGATEDDTGATPTTLSVTPGSDSATLRIPIAADDGETFVVSITPGANDFDWTVAPNGSASATVTISDQAATQQVQDQSDGPVSFGDAAIADRAYTVGAKAIRAPVSESGDISAWHFDQFKLPKITGNDFGVIYTASGLPDGLALNHARIIDGTPTTATANPVTVTYTATRGEGEGASTASLTFRVTVNPPVTFDDAALEFFTNDIIEYTVGQTAPLNLQFPEAEGGTGTLTYHLDNLDPRTPINEYAQGLLFNSATRVLNSDVGENEPAAGQRYALSYWAEDENGSEAVVYGRIVVSAPPSLPAIADQSFTAGDPVSVTLPAAGGGSARIFNLRYRLEPQIPDLSFNSVTRTLSGTATATGSTTMTYTVTDRNDVSGSETFTIAITPGPLAPKTAPGPVQAAQVSGRKYFAVAWAEVKGATRYVVQVAAEGSSFTTDMGVSAWPQGYHVNLQPYPARGAAVTVPEYGNYQVRVAAVNADGAGPWSSAALAVVAEPVRQEPVVNTYSVTPTARVVEGDYYDLTLTLSEPVPAPWASFNVSVGYDSAGAEDVHLWTFSQMTLAAGTTSYRFDIPIRDDAVDEDDETFTVTVSPPTSGETGRRPATAGTPPQ